VSNKVGSVATYFPASFFFQNFKLFKMDEKALLYDAIVAYLISSSATMSTTVKDLLLDPRNVAYVGRLNVQIDTAKLLMTQVIR
jgi:hypothetical protein